MHQSVKDFFDRHAQAEEFQGGRILEVGSYDVNGTLRPQIMKFRPFEYFGTDMRAGPGVDYIIDAARVSRLWPKNYFKAVICTEMLEHAELWQRAVDAMKTVLQPGGVIYLTTRSVGFPLHDYPGDFWRFSKYDIHAAFCDFDIVVLEDDPQDPGVFLKAEKPHDWRRIDIDHLDVYRVSEADAPK